MGTQQQTRESHRRPTGRPQRYAFADTADSQGLKKTSARTIMRWKTLMTIVETRRIPDTFKR